MSIPWGPAFDAELAYRQHQARAGFRPWGWRRKTATARGEALAQHLPAQRQSTTPLTAEHIPAQHLPAQGGPVLIPSLPRPIDQVPVQALGAQVDHEQSSVHAA